PGLGKMDVAGRDVAARTIPQQSVAVGDLVGQVVSAPAASGGRTRCGAFGAVHRIVLVRGYFGDSSVDNHRTAALSRMGESFQRKWRACPFRGLHPRCRDRSGSEGPHIVLSTTAPPAVPHLQVETAFAA